jgi:hypothetical protein
MSTANKILIGLVVLLMVAIAGTLTYLNMSGRLSYFAAAENHVQISADKTSLKAGETFVLTISGEPASGTFSGLYTTLEYDKGALTFQKAENAAFYVGNVQTSTSGDREQAFVKAVNINLPHPSVKTDATKLTFLANKTTTIRQIYPQLLDTDQYTVKQGAVSSNTLTIDVSGEVEAGEISFKLDKTSVKKGENVALTVGINPKNNQGTVAYYINIKWSPEDAVELESVEKTASAFSYEIFKNEQDKEQSDITSLNANKSFWVRGVKTDPGKDTTSPLDLTKITFKALKDNTTVTLTGTGGRVYNSQNTPRTVADLSASFTIGEAPVGTLPGDIAHCVIINGNNTYTGGTGKDEWGPFKGKDAVDDCDWFYLWDNRIWYKSL